jgi:hypothetical protein
MEAANDATVGITPEPSHVAGSEDRVSGTARGTEQASLGQFEKACVAEQMQRWECLGITEKT